jgi:hypothetical protein
MQRLGSEICIGYPTSMRANQVLGARVELAVPESTPHALVLPFEFDWSTLDPAARGAFDFLYDALRRHFIAPALQTSSTPEFEQLWQDVSLRVLDIARAVSTLIHEATSARGTRAIIDAQLVNGDRRAADDLAERTEHAGWPVAAARLRTMNMVISCARACVQEQIADDPIVRFDPFENYREGNEMWFAGISLLGECVLEWLPQHEPRAGLLDNCLTIVESGVRLAAAAAIDLRAVNLFGEQEWFASLFGSLEVIHFLLEAMRRTRAHFGPTVTVSLDHFIEPDTSGPGLTHFRIEANLEPNQACDRFDDFCEQWWDEAVVATGVVIRPVLDVAR